MAFLVSCRCLEDGCECIVMSERQDGKEEGEGPGREDSVEGKAGPEQGQEDREGEREGREDGPTGNAASTTSVGTERLQSVAGENPYGGEVVPRRMTRDAAKRSSLAALRTRNSTTTKIGHRKEVDGQVTYKKSASSDIMEGIQLGLRVMKPSRDIIERDFQEVETLDFPRYFRDVFNIQPSDFLVSLTNEPLKELSNPGASGSLFYLTPDDSFIIKTVQRKEQKFLLRFMNGYLMNLIQNPKTLMPKFFGLFCYKSALGRHIRLVVMNNILPSYLTYDEKFDLKGSTHGRFASAAEKSKKSPTLKDLDYMELHAAGLKLDNQTYEALKRTLTKDCLVMREYGVMDYSLLLGFHYLRDDTELLVGRQQERLKNYRQSTYHYLSVLESLSMDNSGLPDFGGGILGYTSTGKKVVLFLGIIDILQCYRLRKKAEHLVKSLLYDGATVSVVNPVLYSTRFQNFVTGVVFRPLDESVLRVPAIQPLGHGPGQKRLSTIDSLRTTGDSTLSSASAVTGGPLNHPPAVASLAATTSRSNTPVDRETMQVLEEKDEPVHHKTPPAASPIEPKHSKGREQEKSTPFSPSKAKQKESVGGVEAREKAAAEAATGGVTSAGVLAGATAAVAVVTVANTNGRESQTAVVATETKPVQTVAASANPGMELGNSVQNVESRDAKDDQIDENASGPVSNNTSLAQLTSATQLAESLQVNPPPTTETHDTQQQNQVDVKPLPLTQEHVEMLQSQQRPPPLQTQTGTPKSQNRGSPQRYPQRRLSRTMTGSSTDTSLFWDAESNPNRSTDTLGTSFQSLPSDEQHENGFTIGAAVPYFIDTTNVGSARESEVGNGNENGGGLRGLNGASQVVTAAMNEASQMTAVKNGMKG